MKKEYALTSKAACSSCSVHLLGLCASFYIDLALTHAYGVLRKPISQDCVIFLRNANFEICSRIDEIYVIIYPNFSHHYYMGL